MKRREILDETTTPEGAHLELARDGDTYTIRVARVLLMSSATYGSEEKLAQIAAEAVAARPGAQVLVGGLGMGFTLRAALDRFGPTAQITVAELLPAIVRYNQGPLAHLAAAPLSDPRVRLVEGDVRGAIDLGGWDAIILDVDNGPSPLTAASNASLYSDAGVGRIAAALRPGGVVAVWSESPDDAFLRRLIRAGLHAEARTAFARGDVKKGPRHTIFVGRRASPRS